MLTLDDFLHSEFYINHGGLWLILFIVFAETGLLLGFILPGDSLLFVAGIYSERLIKNLLLNGTGSEFLNLLILILMITMAGTLGNIAGYWFGLKSGELLFQRRDSFFFKRKHLLRAKKFYDRHGAQAIIYTRFLPIVRTFAPIIGGIVKMKKRKFLLYSVIGIGSLAAIMLLGGHFLNIFFIEQFDLDLREHLDLILIGIVLITSAPLLLKWYLDKPSKSSHQNHPK